MIVLDVEERKVGDNDINDKFWQEFYGKTIHIVYLLHSLKY